MRKANPSLIVASDKCKLETSKLLKISSVCISGNWGERWEQGICNSANLLHKSHQAHSYFFPKRSYLLWGGEKFENKGIKFGRWGHLTSLLVCSSSKQIQRLMVIFFREGRIKVIRSFINGMNSYISAIGRLKMKNIVKGEMDPRVEFGLQK